MKFGSPTQNHMPMTMKWSKSEPKTKIQHGGRSFTETGSSYISRKLIDHLKFWYTHRPTFTNELRHQTQHVFALPLD